MTPEEAALIEGVFDRLKQVQGLPIDKEAEALIQERVRTTPHAAYGLVRAVILLEQQIQEAEARLDALERRAESGRGGERSAGGFMGGGSVPKVGGPVWSRSAESDRYGSERYGQDRYGEQDRYGQDRFGQGGPQGALPQAGPWGQRAGGGGFLGGVAATAAGVAGGMLAANALSGLFGSNRFGGQAQAAHGDAAQHQGGPTGGDASNSDAASMLGANDIGRGGQGDTHRGLFDAPEDAGRRAYDPPPSDDAAHNSYDDLADGGDIFGGDDPYEV